jgi:hypothetical protein
MGKPRQVHAGLMWFCFATAAVLVAALIATRWFAVDFQTGTNLAVTLDQGTAIAIVGDAPLNLSLELQPHDPDQVAWQWWFASFPHSLLIPLWAPAVVLMALGVALRPGERVEPTSAPPASPPTKDAPLRRPAGRLAVAGSRPRQGTLPVRQPR